MRTIAFHHPAAAHHHPILEWLEKVFHPKARTLAPSQETLQNHSNGFDLGHLEFFHDDDEFEEYMKGIY